MMPSIASQGTSWIDAQQDATLKGKKLYTLGRTPWTGNQRVSRPLPKHIITQ
jgi:hypothetical protein